MASKSSSKVSTQELEKLIFLVSEQPAIYDASRSDYKDIILQENIWTSIANLMGREDICGKEWKKKWRNQRDMYVKKRREMKTAKSGQAAVIKRKWPLMDAMSFLDNFIGPNSTESNLQEPSPGTDSDESSSLAIEDTASVSERWNVDPRTQCQEQDVSESVRSASPTFSTLSTTSQQTGMRPLKRTDRSKNSVAKGGPGKELDNALIELVEIHKKQRKELSTQMNAEEAVPKSIAKCFFDTCTLRMEKLPQETQSFLQLQISQLFFNAENPSFSPVPITMLPRKEVCAPTPAPRAPNEFVYIQNQNTPGIISEAMNVMSDDTFTT